jgi:hypothetical protein
MCKALFDLYTTEREGGKKGRREKREGSEGRNWKLH